MTYATTDRCIGCAKCLPLCPTGAISKINAQAYIDPNLCDNCQDYGIAQCFAGCPTSESCLPQIAPLNATSNYWDTWFSAYERARKQLQTQNDPYWTRWFDRYSQRLEALLN